LIAEPTAASKIKAQLSSDGFVDSIGRLITSLEGRAAEKHDRRRDAEFKKCTVNELSFMAEELEDMLLCQWLNQGDFIAPGGCYYS
jgi:hypothetical protein